jgi:anti-sigma-K factor RskA
MMQGGHIPQEDLILYAMQTLSQEELAVLRLHLDECEVCRVELAAVQGDLALVAMSVEQHQLPDGARQRFIDRIAATSTDGTSGISVLSSERPEARVIPIDTKRKTSRVEVWIPWLAVAALLLFALSLERQVSSLNDELGKQHQLAAQMTADSARAKQVLDVLTAPSSKRVLLTAINVKPVPTARAVYLAETGGLVFQANNLERLAENKTYELWVIPANGQAPIPAGLFKPDATGSANVLLPPLPKGVAAKAFGVTIEKAEGSATPTVPIVLVGAVPNSGD